MSNFTNLTMCSQFKKNQTKPATLRYSLIRMSVQECVLEMPLKLFCRGPVGADTQGSFSWSWLLRRVWPDPKVSLCWEPASPLGWGMAQVRLDPLNFFFGMLGRCWDRFEMSFKQAFCLFVRKMVMAGLVLGRVLWLFCARSGLSPTVGTGCQHR